MSDHYCCDFCGQQYDECVCEDCARCGHKDHAHKDGGQCQFNLTPFSERKYKPRQQCSCENFRAVAKSRIRTLELGKHAPPETWAREGKPEWPDFVTVRMSQYKAWDLVLQLLHQLRYVEKSTQEVEVSLHGTLSESED